MTAPVFEVQHPDDETLAAFVDDRANEATREKVIAHMADCAECRELVLMTSDVVAEETNVVHGRFGGRWIALLAAAAAIAGVVWFVPDVRYKLFGVSPDAVIPAAATIKQRYTPGRLAGFPHRELNKTYRGAGESAGTPAVSPIPADDLGSMFGVYEAAGANAQSRRPNAHTEALAALLIARDGDALNQAVVLFEEALAKADPEERDRITIDYTAALLARGKWNGDHGDLLRALTLAEEVWARTKAPEALWNRASALKLLARDREAKAAWQAYLAVDTSSPWAAEARQNLQTEP